MSRFTAPRPILPARRLRIRWARFFLVPCYYGIPLGSNTRLFLSSPQCAKFLPQVIVTLLEFGGGILLIAGVGVRVLAPLFAIDMLVAILTVHWRNGFLGPGGVEFPLTLLASAVCLTLSGGGALSLKLKGL